VFRTIYRLRVINQATGPKAIDIEITFPIALVSALVGTIGLLITDWKVALNLDPSITNFPSSKSISNPSQTNFLIGVHCDLAL